MMRVVEIAAFGLVATGLHVAVVAQWGDALSGGAVPAASGSIKAVSVSHADSSLQDLVTAWRTPPVTGGVTRRAVPDPIAPPLPDLARKVPAEKPETPRISALEPVSAASEPVRQPDRATALAPRARPEDMRATRAAPAATSRGSAGRAAASDEQTIPAGNDAGLEAAHAAAVRGALAQARHYPDRARDRGIVGRPVLALDLDRSGRLISVALRQSSGSDLLDRASLEAARRARFPAAPPALTRQRFSYEVGVTYALD